MNKDKYINEVDKRLSQLFLASKEGYKATPVERHRLEGFMNAGVVMGLVSNSELAALMDNIHLIVFGKTIRQRKSERPTNWAEEVIDYSGYEQPTYERIK